MAESLPEVWLRGPIEGIPSLLQPAAHALLQAMEEIREAMKDFPDDLLWQTPAAVASPGFHLLHITGVLDRLCTYANGNPLNEEQLVYLKAENTPVQSTAKELVTKLEKQVQLTLEQLQATDEAGIKDRRTVGRKACHLRYKGSYFMPQNTPCDTWDN